MDKVNPVIVSYKECMDASVDFVKDYWEDYLRLYKYWHLQKPDILKKTYSRISLNLFHATAQEKIAKIYNNVFSSLDHVTIRGDTPQAEMFAANAQEWVRDMLVNRLKIQHRIIPTLQDVIIGGSGFRMPNVHFEGGKKTVSSRHVDFLSVLPSPGGGVINAYDHDNSSSLEWAFVIDWWSEDKLKDMAKQGVLDKEQVGKMLSDEPEQNWPEMQYKDEFDEIAGVQYGGRTGTRRSLRGVKHIRQDRRIVHWFQRDKRYIVGQDAFLLREAEPPLGKGIIPLVNYKITPDMDNFYGISYLQIVEDLVQASQMLINYRMDSNLEALHPQTFIDERITRGRPTDEFRHRPFATHTFPGQQIADIRKAVWHDRGENLPQQAWLDEDRLKAMLQKVGGMGETTSSMGDVVGNKTAGGAMAVLNELSGRAFMESTILEHCGLREEVLLLLKAARKFIFKPQYIRNPQSQDEFPWSRVSEAVFDFNYDVVTRGVQFLAKQNENFQKMLALYPYWNQSEVWDNYELNRQVAEVADILPDPEKALKPVALGRQGLQGMASGQRPGGLASSMDINQGEQSRQRESGSGGEPTAARAL